ncbi:hypothetical protein HBI24_211830 [Parastagonospora nodorum]|nr:hypothetical protein HBH52_219260 [Parastagonospora nodorum]KAH4599100.1 hypothetical protein HBH82_209130 [Parastagonospora nodorum]KAH4668442.1 hypothetical protein HBH78_192030 [Parastagonospora nodorum]KAH4699113.1 hypothetical protein HBH67_163760 [Parastagonospora nodorum]KAH4761045.1 hypothetical protein HBH63_210250 [Parastagonospora nodorum]
MLVFLLPTHVPCHPLARAAHTSGTARPALPATIHADAALNLIIHQGKIPSMHIRLC